MITRERRNIHHLQINQPKKLEKLSPQKTTRGRNEIEPPRPYLTRPYHKKCPANGTPEPETISLAQHSGCASVAK